MPKLPKSDGPRKVCFMLPEKEYADLALFAATQTGAPTPGPHMRSRALEDAKQGKELRERLGSSRKSKTNAPNAATAANIPRK